MGRLNLGMVREYFREQVKGNRRKAHEIFRATQLAVYVAAGGGFLGRFAAEQPSEFYIDDRVWGLPYKRQQIEQAVKVLEIMCHELGYKTALSHANKRKKKWLPIPPVMQCHNCGIF